MSKLLLITDLHLKYKDSFGDDRKFYKMKQIDYIVNLVCKSPDILGLVILGDLFHNPNPNEELRNTFFKSISKLFDYSKYFIFIAGNHDSTSTHHCFSGERNIPYKYMKIFTGTEIKPIEIDGFDSLVAVSWYSSLNIEEFYKSTKKKNVLGHLEIQGAKMNNGIDCDKGIIPHLLSQNETKIITGHFHKAQDSKNYSYLGAMYRENFGEFDYQPYYGLLDTDFNLTRTKLVDWNFITINETDTDWKKDYSYLEDEPVAVKFITKKSIRHNFALKDTMILSEIKKLGIKNIKYFSKKILTETMVVDKKSNVILEGSIVDSLLTYSNNDKILATDEEKKALTKWLQNANFESLS